MFMENATGKKTKSKAEAADGSPSYSAPAIDKALDVLELLADSMPGMSLTGIADALGRTKQELFRVLVCLVERGYLVRDEMQIYRLSTKMFEIGSQHASTQTLIARAMPHMERLASTLGESCHLNIVVQNRMLVIARVEAYADVMLTVRVGATFELHRRNSGLVGLAFQPEHRREEYWAQSGENETEVLEWEHQLRQIRRCGYAVADSPIVYGVQDTAAAVLGSKDHLLGVVCVSHVRRTDEPADRPEILETVQQTARAISGEFGPARR
jgi:DNA-binding IclR family transcriptional regulator